ncbi:MAG TPA: Wadjet anti-phage system protein JetD domain-containing protein [Dongiaceae bacterium]|nr:Wadjet anti-phage system protein JetD domain-containing protein [Dongiaceae bacterium]
MKTGFPVLHALARLYAKSQAGRTGAGQRDFLVDFKKLLAAAACEDGDDREAAVRQLRELDGRIIHLEGPRRDPDIIHRVRLPLANEADLFSLLDDPSPSERRQQLAGQFAQATMLDVPERWRESWQVYCRRLEAASLCGAAIVPFSREDFAGNAELLALVPKLLAWHGKGEECLLRFASCALTGDSKRLGELAAEDSEGCRSGKLGSILEQATGGQIRSLEDAGILRAPRYVLIHGPARLLLSGEWLNVGALQGPSRLSETDIDRATQVETSARRCLTVENETSFHKLAELHSGELLLGTSYPGAATLALLRKLPEGLEFWHFGDCDPEGFDILRDLRERSGRPFRALHMGWRPAAGAASLDSAEKRLLRKLLTSPAMQAEREALTAMLSAGKKGNFEQESLGQPSLSKWPFYG